MNSDKYEIIDGLYLHKKNQVLNTILMINGIHLDFWSEIAFCNCAQE